MDRVLQLGFLVVECPITFHQRVGVSKGGNASNWRGFVVGLRMIAGLLTDWRLGQRRSSPDDGPSAGRSASTNI